MATFNKYLVWFWTLLSWWWLTVLTVLVGSIVVGLDGLLFLAFTTWAILVTYAFLNKDAISLAQNFDNLKSYLGRWWDDRPV